MKIVRLKRDVLTAWRLNESHLVDDEGHLVSKVDRALENALQTVMRSARSQRKNLEQRVAIGAREHVISVTVSRTNTDLGNLVVTATIDGHRIVTGREVICAQMFQEHGECQLRGPNSHILKTVRDLSVHRPTFAESQQLAPRPEHCPCKHWGKPHPGTHYPTCQFNRLAPPEERAPSDSVPEEEARFLPTEAFRTLARPMGQTATVAPIIVQKLDPGRAVAQGEELDPPDHCRNGCLEWATPKGYPIPPGQHHPTCYFAKAWAIKTSREELRVLVDLNTGERVRHATDQEVGEAQVSAQRTGSPVIDIDGVPHAVVLEKELDAEEKATGNAKASETLFMGSGGGTPPLPAPEPGIRTPPSPERLNVP